MSDIDRDERPSFGSELFVCMYPDCGAYAHQTWLPLLIPNRPKGHGWSVGQYIGLTPQTDFDHWLLKLPQNVAGTPYFAAFCAKCNRASIWRMDEEGKLVHPTRSMVGPRPNPDVPDSVLKDYMEASAIADRSPRAAAALLRLAVEKLCHIAVGDESKSLNECIKLLVGRGLPEDIQKALDVVRVIGNHAIHPGEMSLDDEPDTVDSLFRLVNLICQATITQQRMVSEMFTDLPAQDRSRISKRDGKQPENR